MNIVNCLMLDHVTVATSDTTDPVELFHMLYYDIIASVTGTCTGTIKLQKTDDPAINVTNGTAVWFDITSSSQSFTNATTLNWTASDIGFSNVRAVVTTNSGTAVVTIRLNAKGFM